MHLPVRRVAIDPGADRSHRAFLIAVSPEPIRTQLIGILSGGPLPGGAAEAAKHFGSDLQNMLLVTVPVVDELEWCRPGIKKWLDATGFGNDWRVIEAFAHWSMLGNRASFRASLHERSRLQ